MPLKEKILIVEDEAAIVRVLATMLETNEYTPLTAATGEQALLLARSHQPDLILLDLGLPDMDGMDVLKKLRECYDKPIIIVSARDQDTDKANGLDRGADDYLTKPFSGLELSARIRAALRRQNSSSTGGESVDSVYSVGEFSIDFQKHSVYVEGVQEHLTPIEFKIVELLAKQPGRVLTYDYLMKHIWGPYLTESNKILRVNMANIRRKIEINPAEPQFILTEMGIGYCMAETTEK